MNPITEYQNVKNSSEAVKSLFAREWVLQMVKGGSLPSSHSIGAVGYISSNFGYKPDQAYSIIRSVLDDCEAIRKSLNHYDAKMEEEKKYIQGLSPQNQPTQTNEALFEQVVETAFDLLKKGHDSKEVAEFLSPEYLFLDDHPVKLNQQEIDRALAESINRFEDWKR
ncbi:hypothetical protein [Spirosoma endophyticum]|uniref:Uncharacterized protein n=1 Tax=Spirosoma endophyticum TaxID=662367 RepID=A0A1I2ER35_9BACT|nr:hypothetical protein [Spirosoma endophyticum]SFE95285.1 hypothetical protein SAMN05216167_12311 [Spirosoma endophyticum]